MEKTRSFIVISVVIAITLVSGWLISQLKFDYDFEDFFPQNDPATEYYFNFRKSFETDNDFFIVALENEKGIFDPAFLARVDSLTKELRTLPYIEEVVGPTDLVEFMRDPFMGGLFQQPLLRWQEPEYYAIDSATIYSRNGYVGVFFAPDGKSVAINMKHQQQLSKAKGDEFSDRVVEMVGKYSFDHTHIIGRTFGQRLYVTMMIKELALFLSLSLLLTIVFLYVAFRSGWGIFIPVTVVMLSILWTMGFLKIIGKDIDLMLTVLPTIIFVVGMSDSVHVLTKYLQELRNGKEKIAAIKYAFKSIRLATFLTALTTSVGFLTLVFSNIKPISDFGIYSSVGVMLAYGLTYTLLPAILILAQPQRLQTLAISEDFWTKKLHRVFQWILRKRKIIFIGGIVMVLVSSYLISTIKVDNVMLEDLRDSHLLKQEFRFMEEHFAGCRPFEMGIQLNGDAYDAATLHQLDLLDTYLRKEYGLRSMLTLTELIKSSNRSMNAGMEEYYALPEDSLALSRIQRLLNRDELQRITHLAYDEERKLLRISGKVGDVGRIHYEKKNEELALFIGLFCPNLSNFEVTGTAQLIDVNNRMLVDSMVWDLLLSVAVIGLIMGVVYKSWKMILLTIIPNLIPLVIVGGIMGLAGIPLKVSTSIIFNIAFGIAVDDTIHFLARVRTLLNEGVGTLYAVKRTFLTTGKAMIVTTLILSGGFLTLIFSDFLGTFYIGLLISLTLFIAIIAELLFTPLVFMFFYRHRK